VSTAGENDFMVVEANRDLRIRLVAAEQTIVLLRQDLASMTRVADEQYLREQEAKNKAKWLTLVVRHLQAKKPLPHGWEEWPIEAIIKHVFEVQTNERKAKAAATPRNQGENSEHVSTTTNADERGSADFGSAAAAGQRS